MKWQCCWLVCCWVFTRSNGVLNHPKICLSTVIFLSFLDMYVCLFLSIIKGFWVQSFWQIVLLCMWSNRKRKNTSEQEWSLITMVVILSHVWTYDHVSLHFFLTLAQSLIIMKCKFHWWEGLCFRLGEITAQACMLKKYFNQYINTGILTYLSKQTSFHVNSLFCCFHFKSSEELFPFLRFFFN